MTPRQLIGCALVMDLLDGSGPGQTIGEMADALLASIAARGYALVPREATPEMLVAAREWSRKKYGKPIGNDGANGCWAAMLFATENGLATARGPRKMYESS